MKVTLVYVDVNTASKQCRTVKNELKFIGSCEMKSARSEQMRISMLGIDEPQIE